MTPIEALRRASGHMAAAVVTEPGPVRDTIAAKADALQLWGLIGAAFGAVSAILLAVGVYYLAASVGALCALIPGLWEATEAELRKAAAHDGIVSVLYASVAAWLWWLTKRLMAVMARSIEGEGVNE